MESGVPFVFCDFEGLRAFLGSFGFEIIIHLADNCLQISFEQTVSECNQEKCKTGKGQQPGGVGCRSKNWNGKNNVSGGHYNKTCFNSSFVILSAVSNQPSDKT